LNTPFADLIRKIQLFFAILQIGFRSASEQDFPREKTKGVSQS